MPSNHLFYINHVRAGRRATGVLFFFTGWRKRERENERDSAGRERKVNGRIRCRSVFKAVPAREKSRCMSLAVMRCLDSRRKPPSWKTCVWIDRFLYAIVAIVMPVALYKSLVHRLLPFVGRDVSLSHISRVIIPPLNSRRLFPVRLAAFNFTSPRNR